MLGDTLIVAPVVDEGAVSRDVYLPRGGWVGNNGITYIGPQRLTGYPAPLNTLPYFMRRVSASAIVELQSVA